MDETEQKIIQQKIQDKKHWNKKTRTQFDSVNK